MGDGLLGLTHFSEYLLERQMIELVSATAGVIKLLDFLGPHLWLLKCL